MHSTSDNNQRRSPIFTGEQDRAPSDYVEGQLWTDPATSTPGGIHGHETTTGRTYRHSHADWDQPHRHTHREPLRDTPHEFEPSEFTKDRRNPTRPACAICGNSERATVHGR